MKVLPPITQALFIGTLIFALRTALADDEQLDRRIEELENQLDALADSIERQDKADSDKSGKVSIGGYGELHYNNLTAEDDSRNLQEVDFHRFVLLFGYEFSDNVRLVSELEFEHAFIETTEVEIENGELEVERTLGELELEQAYLEFDHASGAATQVGLFLLPVGILNETHEPTTFYGVERNDVESIIIPSTWWEGGAQHIRRFGKGWQWNIAVHSGLAVPSTGDSAFRVRSGRQKVAEAAADNLAATTRIKYTGIAGLELATSVQWQTDPSQTGDDGLDDGMFYEAHVAYNKNRFGLRALYAAWTFSGDAVDNAANSAGAQSGWYIEPSFKLSEKIGIYARASSIEAVRSQDNFDQAEIGLNWWPHPKIVLKVDWRDREHMLSSELGRDFHGFDLGMGYYF